MCLWGPAARVTSNLLLFQMVSFYFPLTLVAVGWGSVWLICLQVRCTHFSGKRKFRLHVADTRITAEFNPSVHLETLNPPYCLDR